MTDLDGLRLIYKDAALPARPLAPGLQEAYGGPLDLTEGIVYSNFVASIDGVAVLEEASPSAISLAGKQDRFLMALLRAFADVILVGAGTLRAEKDHSWTAGYLAPQFKDELSELRRSLGRKGDPLLAVATRSADLPPGAKALRGALVLTSNPSHGHLRDAGVDVALLNDTDPASIIEELRRRGCNTILCEGGPQVMGGLLAEGLLDEIFLTISPTIAGRSRGSERPGMVSGRAFEPKQFPTARLLSTRVAGSYLFLRYRLSPG